MAQNASEFLEGYTIPESDSRPDKDFANPLKVVGTIAAVTVLTPGAGLRAAYELLKTGDLNKANAILEKVLQFPVDQLNDKEKAAASQLTKIMGTPIEKAGQGWEMIVSSIPGAKETVLPTLANIFGQSAAVFGLSGKGGKMKAADFLEKNIAEGGSESLISASVGAKMISPEDIAARLEGKATGKGIVDSRAFKSVGDPIAEGKKLGLRFDGMQKSYKGEEFPYFTDPETGSTFLVTDGDVQAALDRTRAGFKTFDVMNQKKQHRQLLSDLMEQGYLTEDHIIRGTDVDYFKEMAESGSLPLGESFEGEGSISAYKISKGQSFEDLPMYGANEADHVVMIGKSDMVEAEGSAPSEVWINPDTGPEEFTYLYKGQQYSYGDLKGELGY